MATILAGGGGGQGSPGGTGSGGGIASFGGTATVTTNNNDNSNAAVQTGAGQMGPVMNAGEGSTLTYNGSDYGAIAAATTVFGNALNLASSAAHDSQITSRLLSSQAQDTVAAQGAQALNLITKPLIWIVGLIVAAWILIAFFKRDKKHAS
jgi:hypothetical protein